MRRWLGRCLLLLLAASAPAAASLQSRLDAMVARRGLDGAALVVLREGVEVASVRSGEFDRRTVVPIASASKWLNVLLLARLVEQDRLRWDDAVGRWLPDAPAATRAITIAQLVSHTSGIDPDAGGKCSLRAAPELRDCVQRILAEPLVAKPGARFDYGGASMQVAALIAERAGGAGLASLFEREVAAPLGLRDTRFASLWFWQPARIGNPSFGAGLHSNAHDLARVMAMLSRGGVAADGRRYLTRASLDAIALDRRRGTTTGRSPGAGYSQGYGLGVWLHSVDAQGRARRASSPGAFGTTPWLDRDTGLAAVLVTKGRFNQLKGDILALQLAVEKTHGAR